MRALAILFGFLLVVAAAGLGLAIIATLFIIWGVKGLCRLATPRRRPRVYR